jgi:HSP20 family protein
MWHDGCFLLGHHKAHKEEKVMLWSDFEEFGKWLDPWREFQRFSRALAAASSPSAYDFPAVNVWTSPDHAVVTTEIPGIDPGAVDITIADKTLTLRGSRQPEEVKEEGSYHRRERWHGQFTKTVALPFSVEADRVTASVSNGVLSVSLPRAEAEKPKKIEISTN